MSLRAVSEDATTHFNNNLPILNRRRSLFPNEATDSESDSDLGHISPLNFDSSFDLKCLTKQSQNADKTVGDYDIIGVVENQIRIECTPQGKHSQIEVMSPLYLSPYYNKLETTVAETPSKTSCCFKLKTPHDAQNTNLNLPKLLRKSLLDSEVSSNKRKLSPQNSPLQNKQLKLDPKSSRVRTTLFPEVDLALPTKSFYPKSEDIVATIMKRGKSVLKSSVSFSTNRKSKSRKKIGQINSGVGHKIRKPKQKKMNKRMVPLSAMESTAINEYIMDLKELKSNKDPSKLIESKENIQSPQKLITPAIMPEKNIESAESKKRPFSILAEPDPNKKFFKFSRAKGVVKMNKNIKLEVNHGKMSFLENNKHKNKNDFDMTDLIAEDSDLPKTNIESILSCLEDEDEAISEGNRIVLQATSSVVTSDNSILLHQPTHRTDLILSPISLMCDVTSGLVLTTPKKVRNLTPILEEIDKADNGFDDQKQDKLFPIFYPGHACNLSNKVNVLTNSEKKFKKLPDDQMLLDAGQKKFGITQCPECNFVYHEGDPNDEMMHLDFHNARRILKFQGWKNERIVAVFENDCRIIQIIPGDSKIWWKKAKDLMDAINMELGCCDMEFSLDNCQVFLYIKKKTIIGVLVATPKSEGYQLLTPTNDEVDLCSHHAYPIKCGILRIWVSANNRKVGIATQMMNTLKKNFIKESLLYDSDIAFSSPTDTGKAFAQKYFKTKNFFVYLD